MQLGTIIYQFRKRKNVTQEELAAELGVTATAVSKWEKGYTLPDVLMLCALADYFQVTTDELLGRDKTGNMQSSPPKAFLLANRLPPFPKSTVSGPRKFSPTTKKLQP